MRATKLPALAIVLLATTLATIPTINEANQSNTGSGVQSGQYAADRRMIQELLDRQPMIYQEILNGQLKPRNQMQGNQLPNRDSPPHPGALGPADLKSNTVPGYPQPTLGKCVPTSTKPDIESAQQFPINTVASADHSVMANLVGYVELLKSTGPNSRESTYLPLDINFISLSEPDCAGTRVVTLSGPCVSFKISYKMAIGTILGRKDYKFGSFDMFIKDFTKPGMAPEKICEFDQPFAFKLPSYTRYFCEDTTYGLTHQCYVVYKPVANLVLKRFELELDGDKGHVMRGKFSKPRWDDSCMRWPE